MNPKNEIRTLLKRKISALSPEEKKIQSSLLCDRLLKYPGLQKDKCLGVYLPLPDEPDLTPALTTLLEKEVALFLPFLEKNGVWGYRRIVSLQSKKTGPWNLELPEAGEPIHPQELDIILVPGRGFTAKGDRIGRGKGIYDQLLCDTSAAKIGIGFICQRVAELPTEKHDVRLDEVWTA